MTLAQSCAAVGEPPDNPYLGHKRGATTTHLDAYPEKKKTCADVDFKAHTLKSLKEITYAALFSDIKGKIDERGRGMAVSTL